MKKKYLLNHWSNCQNIPSFARQTEKRDLATLFPFKFGPNLLKIGRNWVLYSGQKGLTGQIPKNAATSLTILRPFLTIFMATLFAPRLLEQGIVDVDLDLGFVGRY